MATKVLIPTALRQYAEKMDSVEVEARTVGELLDKLTRSFNDLRRHLFNEEGQLRSFVNVYVNEEDVRYLQREQTPLSGEDVVSIVPSIAGGR